MTSMMGKLEPSLTEDMQTVPREDMERELEQLRRGLVDAKTGGPHKGHTRFVPGGA
jgi:hypothetical protein